MPVTEENVLALIEEYRNGKEPGEKAKAAGFTSYANGSSYDAYNPAYRILFPDGYHNGTECAKFAFAFFEDIFGSDVPIREITNPADVRPGDLLHFSGHWSIATEKARYNSVYEDYDGRDVGGGANGQIGWSNSSINISRMIAAYTRYPLPYEFSDTEVHLTAEAPIGTPLSSLEGLDSVRLEDRKTN